MIATSERIFLRKSEPSFRKAVRDVAWPREHGSWSLAFEPIALGLLVVPTLAGGWLALAATAAFFARRPLRIAFSNDPLPRRQTAHVVLCGCAIVAGTALAIAISFGRAGWAPWILGASAAGAVFGWYDSLGRSRQIVPEIAGAASFSLLSGAIAALGGFSSVAAAAVAAVMLARSVPTVLFVRGAVRERKSGEAALQLAALVSFAAILATTWLASRQLVPAASVGLAVALGLRSILFPTGTGLPARTIGVSELVLGVAYVAITASTWNLE